MSDPLSEIPIVIITVMAMFILLIAVGAFLVVRYQKKKFEYVQHIFTLQKEHEAAILQSQLEIQEQTFQAISQEVHDNVGQILSLAKVQLNIASSTLQDPQGIIVAAGESVGRAMADLRDIARSLSTDRISQMDLILVIRQETDRINKTQLLNCSMQVIGIPVFMTASKKLVIFRMVQEILNNILKHADARHADIIVDFEPLQLRLEINDNGRGFQWNNETNSGGGMGLHNIIKRTAMIGGKAVIDSALGSGTHIQLNIPYE